MHEATSLLRKWLFLLQSTLHSKVKPIISVINERTCPCTYLLTILLSRSPNLSCTAVSQVSCSCPCSHRRTTDVWRHEATESELQILHHETDTICLCDRPHAIASRLSYYAARVVHVGWGTGHVAPTNGTLVCGKIRSKEPVVFKHIIYRTAKKMSGGNYVRNCKRGLMLLKLKSSKVTEWTVRRSGAFQSGSPRTRRWWGYQTPEAITWRKAVWFAW